MKLIIKSATFQYNKKHTINEFASIFCMRHALNAMDKIQF